MKFKGTYSWNNGYRIGRFYNSDIKKICASLKYFDNPMPDEQLRIADEILAMRVRDEKQLFFSVKKESRVFGYGGLTINDSSGHMVLDAWKRNVKIGIKDIVGMFHTILNFSFDIAHARRITLIASNPRICRLYERVGFQMEGIMRKAAMYDGKPEDIYIYGLLKEDYYGT